MTQSNCFIAPLILSILLVVPTLGQQSSSSSSPYVRRDAQALTIVNKSLGAMGGQAAIASIQDADAVGTCSDQAVNGTTSTTTQSTFEWTVAGNAYRYQTIENGQATITVSGNGQASRSESGVIEKVSPSDAQATLPFHLPGVLLLQELNNPEYSFRAMGNQQTAQGPAQEVAIAIAGPERPVEGSTQLWYFSTTNGQPLQVVYTMPSEHAPELGVRVTTSFSGYSTIDGALLPTRVTISVGDFLIANCTASTIHTNVHPSEAIFESATGGGF